MIWLIMINTIQYIYKYSQFQRCFSNNSTSIPIRNRWLSLCFSNTLHINILNLTFIIIIWLPYISHTLFLTIIPTLSHWMHFCNLWIYQCTFIQKLIFFLFFPKKVFIIIIIILFLIVIILLFIIISLKWNSAIFSFKPLFLLRSYLNAIKYTLLIRLLLFISFLVLLFVLLLLQSLLISISIPFLLFFNRLLFLLTS
jgi:hypothetical protein